MSFGLSDHFLDERALLMNVFFNSLDIRRDTEGELWCECVQPLHPNSASLWGGGGGGHAAFSDTCSSARDHGNSED